AIEGSPDGHSLAVWRSRQVDLPMSSIWVEKLKGYLGLAPTKNTDLEVWGVGRGSRLAALHAGGDYTFSPHGKLLAVWADGHPIETWDIPPRKPLGWFLGLAGLLLLLTLAGFWWQVPARREKRQAALATETIPCGT